MTRLPTRRVGRPAPGSPGDLAWIESMHTNLDQAVRASDEPKTALDPPAAMPRVEQVEIESVDEAVGSPPPPRYVYRQRAGKGSSSVLTMTRVTPPRRARRRAATPEEHLAWKQAMLANLDRALDGADEESGSFTSLPPDPGRANEPGRGSGSDLRAAWQRPVRLRMKRIVLIVLATLAIAESGCLAHRLLTGHEVVFPVMRIGAGARPTRGVLPARVPDR